ncbi:MAG: PPOX class F420-dependent oxidoreductase [Jatrophihabitans sp.]|uniref:PPOX class F420-dependent oxidoreductase n=1 Tax=Jatrophihabitans sp. TaxID=1932789 RepID=UPI003F7F59D0
MFLSPDGLAFVTERHLATLTTLHADGRPQVTPVGFTWDDAAGLARVITSGTSVKARNAERGAPVVLCQVDGRRWLSLEGTATVARDADAVRDAERRYAERYRVPRENPHRVALMIAVSRAYGSAVLLAGRPVQPGTPGAD